LIPHIPKYKVTLAWRASDTTEAWDNIMHWCIEHFGLPGCRWISASSLHETVFTFEDIEDASFFSMRWVR
jgi:hypothetical protein